MPRVLEVIKRREKATRSIELQYFHSNLKPGSSFSHLAEKAPSDVQVDRRPGRLVISGNQMRLESISHNFLEGGTPGEIQPTITAFNGHLNQLYLPKGAIAKGQAVLEERERPSVGLNAITAGVVFVYRMYSEPSFDLTPSRVTIAQDMIVVRDVPCILMTMSAFSNRDQQHRCFLDPSRNFIPMRIQYLKANANGEEVPTIDLRYKAFADDPAHGFVPLEWEFDILRGDGSLFEASTITIDSYKINHDVNASEFTLSYPEGTVVIDRRLNEQRFVVNKQQQLVRETPRERYSVGDDPARSTRTLILFGNVAFLAIAIIVYVGRHLRRGSSER